jgi:hypothetical protein
MPDPICQHLTPSTKHYPIRVSYSVTSIMSQRSLLNQSLGNIFYEAIRPLGFI